MQFQLFGRRVEITTPIRIRRAAPCGACADRGWFYTIGTQRQMPPPVNCSGVALCGCGAAEHHTRGTRRNRRRTTRQIRFYSRMSLRRRALLAVTFGRAGRGEPPF
ncbi:hypothetical protein [Actinomadura bangladeshensis]|uniref:Uncharacterized protein n=1 Tax=Actinomadura bangladeshensis TaxID=453573 RepID=A0A6L9QAY7_9ACTN|nr:hypothetical protein [Actinomadura bangladeshensis]NEA22630.1 hypothetical protein [Actinomadura bangladeshensis]